LREYPQSTEHKFEGSDQEPRPGNHQILHASLNS
jgi:hypothetical protein